MATGYHMAVIVGEPCGMDPIAADNETEEHHLGRTPDGVVFYFECKTDEDSYDAGDRVYLIDNDGADWGFSANATHVSIQAHDATPDYISNAGTPVAATMTAANWKAVAVPYIFEPTSVIGN